MPLEKIRINVKPFGNKYCQIVRCKTGLYEISESLLREWEEASLKAEGFYQGLMFGMELYEEPLEGPPEPLDREFDDMLDDLCDEWDSVFRRLAEK